MLFQNNNLALISFFTISIEFFIKHSFLIRNLIQNITPNNKLKWSEANSPELMVVDNIQP
jgi:hypothetical protein